MGEWRILLRGKRTGADGDAGTAGLASTVWLRMRGDEDREPRLRAGRGDVGSAIVIDRAVAAVGVPGG